jgi:hypothetical protein
VVLVGESGGIDASNNATFNLRLPQTIFATGADPFYPAYVQDLSVGTFTHPSTGVPCCVPLYSDGVYLPWCVPHVASSNSDFANNSTPDERGVRWTQIGNMTCAGASVYLRGLTAGGNANVKLYAVGNDSAAPLASFTITHSTFFIGTGVQQVAEVHWAGVDLTDGSDYRLTVQPSTTNTIRQTSLDLLSQAAREALSPYWQTTRTRTADGDAGAWTDDKNKFEVLWPLFSALTSGAGGGGLLRHPGMSGGLSA